MNMKKGELTPCTDYCVFFRDFEKCFPGDESSSCSKLFRLNHADVQPTEIQEVSRQQSNKEKPVAPQPIRFRQKNMRSR
ncbi:hypothetical protein HZH66_006293 [Vespula vulgaris]|uniref:Uncharacterized protein n=1 Tax=Vespula vulgaris TaxID=7454 RepID=A0A834K389_VESVU|nr:hypothetical protein HZH66_006293 [Vespula vulgaris]